MFTLLYKQGLWQKMARSDAKSPSYAICQILSTNKDTSAQLLLTERRMPHGTQLAKTRKETFNYSKASLTDLKLSQDEKEHQHYLKPPSVLHRKRDVMPLRVLAH